MDIGTGTPSKITTTHLALAKGWVNGLPLDELAQRYLAHLGGSSGQVDLRIAKRALAGVLHELANAAVRNKIDGSSVLFRQAARIRTNAEAPTAEELGGRPSFDDFKASMDDADEFSDEELLAVYEDRFPPLDEDAARALQRRSRLVARQLDLLARLLPLTSEPMRPGDKVEWWIPPPLAHRLVDAGIDTIRKLAVTIASNPGEWFSSLQGIGRGKAARLSGYLRANLSGFDSFAASRKPIPVEVAVPPRPPGAFGSDLVLPEATVASTVANASPVQSRETLDGSQGRLRNRQNAAATDAPNDYEAMRTWLRTKRSESTKALYEREVTRLIAWSVQVRGRAMSSLSIEDALAYRDFLASPPATAIVPKGPRPRSASGHVTGDGGKPIHVAGFAGPSLKTSSVKKALVIVGVFFSWAVKTNYVTANPFAGVQPSSSLPGVGMGSTKASDTASIERARERRSTVLARVLPLEATDAINLYLDTPPTPEHAAFHARARFIFKFALMTGLRISEIAAARRDHLEYVPPDSLTREGGGWVLHVLGKRDKPREVPMPEELIVELQVYLVHRRLLEAPSPALAVDKGVFLVGAYPRKSEPPKRDIQGGHRTREDGVRPQTIHLALKELFRLAIHPGAFRDSETEGKMRKASTHWLRHTLATRSATSGVPLAVVRDVLGHASLTTTSIYIQTERKVKQSEMQKYWSQTTRPAYTDVSALVDEPPKEA